MALQDGSPLGPYRIVSRLGVGGMGEVYRAHDDRLGRDVAVKILPADVAGDPERLDRFEREARASAALNHPNIVAVHDVGRTGDVSYVVMELLEGATLRDELDRRPPTVRKALEWTVGVANGLAAAHAKGIVHRDVKPENLVVTSDGHIKILDFGIARFTVAEQSATDAVTVAAGTEPGKVMGTAGYMSPEQVRGEEIDARSDIFSLGAVLFEMLAGERAFAGETAVETMHAVLKTDPPELAGSSGPIPPALDRIVRRCLEKRPEDRFHSAHDLALALEAISGSHTQPVAALPVPSRRPDGLALAAAAVVLVGATAAATLWWASPGPSAELPSIRQLTVRRGTIDAARFRASGDSVVYSARFAGAPPAPFETHQSSPEAQQIGPDNALLFAESDGALALGQAPELFYGNFAGTLAVLPAGATRARELAPQIIAADFVESGLAAVEDIGGTRRLHFPLGTVVEETPGRLRSLRASPDGMSIAFVLPGEGIVVLAADGTRHVVDPEGATGLAWSPAGDRLWLSRATGPGESTISVLELGGTPEEVWRSSGSVVLEDVASDGRLLVRRDEVQGGTLVLAPGLPDPVDLSWLDQSEAVAISAVTNAILLRDAAGFYLRTLDGSPAVRLGGGRPLALSADGQFVLSWRTPDRFDLTPVGVGTPRELAHPGITSTFAWFHPDGRRILFNGREPGGPWRFYLSNLDGTGIEPLGPDNFDHYVGQEPLSSDGRLLAGIVVPGEVKGIYSVERDEMVPVEGSDATEAVIRFADNDRELYVYNRDELPARVYRLDLLTGERRLWREFLPRDPAGISGFVSIAMTPDGQYIAFNYRRVLSTLFEIGGLR